MWVMGIAGGSGSGKSTIVEHIRADAMMTDIALLPHDAYYLNRNDMPDEVRELRNWDHPDSLDNALFLHHIQELLAGRAIHRPVYNFKKHQRAAKSVRVEPKPILLVEGILILAIPTIRDLINLRIFVDTPADLRILRRVRRDMNERGRSLPDIMKQYFSTTRPMHEAYVEPSRVHAHLMVPWSDYNSPAVETILARMRAILTTPA